MRNVLVIVLALWSGVAIAQVKTARSIPSTQIIKDSTQTAQIALRGVDKLVNTYADLVALGTVSTITTVMVVSDEKRQDSYTVYKLYPSGKRIFIVTLEDN